jgi:hypothetical protein
MGLYVKTASGTWSTAATARVKTAASTWSSVVRGFVKTASGTWSQFWPMGLTPVIASPVTIAQSTGVDYLVTLTGTNYRWTNFSSGTYSFDVSTDGVNWSSINSGVITNPAVGSSNTKTYTITQGNLTANVANYFRFSVSVTSSTSTTTTSTSGSTTVEMPRNITNLTATPVSNTRIDLSWTASAYAGRQMVQYKTSTSGSWTTSGDGAGGYSGSATSASITGLVSSTDYNFRIRPWTGSANDSGYYGNYSNQADAKTLPFPTITLITGQGANTNPFMQFRVYTNDSQSIAFTVTRTGTNAGSTSGTTNVNVLTGIANVNSGSNSTAYSITATPYTGLSGTGTAGTAVTSRSITRVTTSLTILYP